MFIHYTAQRSLTGMPMDPCMRDHNYSLVCSRVYGEPIIRDEVQSRLERSENSNTLLKITMLLRLQ